MALPPHLFEQIRALRRAVPEWFSIEEIKKRDKDIEIAARYVQRGTDKEVLVVRRSAEDLYEKLEKWGERLLEGEIRSFDHKVWRLYSENLYVPTAEDDISLREEFTQYINESADAIRAEISNFTKYKPEPSSYGDRYSRLRQTVRSLSREFATVAELEGELLRLESIDGNPEAANKLEYGQIKIERFFSHNYREISHPYQIRNKYPLPSDRLARAIRFLTSVIFEETEEPRLKGLRQKFVSIFFRYLNCSRESPGAMASVAEQVSGVLEPFLKKIALNYFDDTKDEKGTPLWHKSLEQLIRGLGLCSVDLTKSEDAFWAAQNIPDAAFRLAFRLRHVGTHEAHDNPPYENEKLAYFVFATLLIASDILVESHPAIRKKVDLQVDVDAVRDLCVKIEELSVGPEGPRTETSGKGPPSRLQRLLVVKSRVEILWPNCSAKLRGLLESEYLTVKAEIEETEREQNIEAYLDAQRDDDYQ
jgi:hypothetical protein